MVVDRDMDPVPAEAVVGVAHSSSVDAVTAARWDPPEHLRVEMDELTGTFALVAHDRWPRFEPVESAETLAPEDRVHARAGETRLPGEDVRSHPKLAPASAEPSDQLGRMTAGLVDDRARPIGETTQLGAVPPLRASLAADASGPRGRRDRPARPDPVGQQRSAVR